MKQPRHIWFLFVLCLAVVTPTMVWLSVKTLQLDRARELDRHETEIARQEAELQERISSALWRMDWVLTPLVAQEAARPYFMYQPFYLETHGGDQVDGNTGVQTESTLAPVPSPLLEQPSEYVLLHFQIGPDNTISSPQCPTGEKCELAVSSGVSQQNIDQSCRRLADVQQFCQYQPILYACPDTKLPAAQTSSKAWENNLTLNYAGQSLGSNSQAILQEPGADQLKQQLEMAIDQQSIPSPGLQSDDGRVAQQRLRNTERGSSEFMRRNRATQTYAMNQWVQNAAPQAPQFVHEGVMRPMWIGDKLILARRVEKGTTQVVQCCWLDWQRIKRVLLEEVADVLPNAQLEPIADGDPVRFERALATLPAQIVVHSASAAGVLPAALNPSGAPASSLSGLRLTLILAWLGLLCGVVAVALLLHGVIKLSERRAAFVSAVTHELRTPLTTFRMYAEMLAERMVTSEEKQQQYASTLRVEADRLAHLVENVLQYARLERGSATARKESMSVQALWDRVQPRLRERAEQAEMKLSLALSDQTASARLETEPAAVEQILFNLVDNACKYAAAADNRSIELSCTRRAGNIEFRVRDYGPGIDARDARRMFQPFRKSEHDHTVPGVGLGLALCQRMARQLGGWLAIEPGGPGATLLLKLPVEARK